MKEAIETKIEELVHYIINKQVEDVTLDDYTILTNELREIQNKESQAANGQRMAELMGLITSNSCPAPINVFGLGKTIMSEYERYIFNLRYVLRVLRDESYSREELIKEFEQELQHATAVLKSEESRKEN